MVVKKILPRLIIAFLLGWMASSLAGTASAGNNTWTNIGPEGGTIVALAIDPKMPATLFAGTDGSGVYKSTDQGGTWNPANTGLTAAYIRALAIDIKATGTLFAGSDEGGIATTANGGGNWSSANRGLVATTVNALLFSSQAPARLYAGLDYAGVYQRNLATGDWTSYNTGLPQNTSVFSLLLDSTLAIDPTPPATLYAGLYDGIYASANGGGIWTSDNEGLPENPNIKTLVVDHASPVTLYTGTTSGAYKCTPGGTWTAFDAGLPSGTTVNALALSPVAPGTLIAGTDRGVYMWTASSLSWNAINTGLPDNLFVFSLAIDPAKPTTLYAGAFGRGTFISQNNGQSWSPINVGLTNADVRAVAIDPAAPSNVYIGTDSGVFQQTLLPPAITHFSPQSAPVGTRVTISGTGFTEATGVMFNGTPALFIVVSDTQLTATVPEHASSGLIMVTTPAGTATSTDSFSVPVNTYLPLIK